MTDPAYAADQISAQGPNQPMEWTEPLALRISHLTHYHYNDVARDSFNEARLRPVDDATQTCIDFQLDIQPAPVLREYPDFYNNTVHYFDIIDAHQDLHVLATSVVHTKPDPRGPAPAINRIEDLDHLPVTEEYYIYQHPSSYVMLDEAIKGASLEAYPEEPPGDIWHATQAMGNYINSQFTYAPLQTNVNTKPNEVLVTRKGVCQDFAHLLLGMCRSRGIPARYVSGYFYNPDKQPGQIEASHAWVEVYLPHYGWKGYDPTHDRLADTRYVKIAVGSDYADIRPVSGTFRGRGTREMIVEVHIDRIEFP